MSILISFCADVQIKYIENFVTRAFSRFRLRLSIGSIGLSLRTGKWHQNRILSTNRLNIISDHIQSQMLNYHIIHPQPFKASNAEYNHFLSLGSHSTAISLGSLLSFSTVSLHKGTKLYIDQNFVEEGTTFNAVVNLGKCVRVNGEVCGKGSVVMHVKVVEDVVEPEIEGKQPSKQQSKVLYLLIRDTPSPTPSESLTCQPTPLTPNISITLHQIAESQQLGMPKKTLVLIESGCLQMPSTSQQVEQSTCIFSREGCPNVIAVRPTTVVVISGI